MNEKKFKYLAVLPDGSTARRRSAKNYGFVVAARKQGEPWQDRGWRADAGAAETLRRAELKRGWTEAIVVRAIVLR